MPSDTSAARSARSEPRRDPFSEAKDAFALKVVSDKHLGEAAVKVAIVLVIGFANRNIFLECGGLKAWPSMRLLAQRTGMFRGRIDRALKALEGAGYLTVERPEKRGATHHNTYTLNVIGRADEANSEEGNGLTTVTNSIGRADEANSNAEKDQIGRTDEAAMAAPVDPKLLEKPLDGGRALGRASAYSNVRGSSSEDDEDIHVVEQRDISAPDGPNVTLSDLSPRRSASEEEKYVGTLVTLADLERLAAEERAAIDTAQVDPSDTCFTNAPEMDPEVLACEALAALHGDALADPEGFVIDVLDGFPEGNIEAADRAARISARLLLCSGDRASFAWRDHRNIVRLLFQNLTGSTELADAAAADFHACVAAVGEEIKSARRRDLIENSSEGGVANA